MSALRELEEEGNGKIKELADKKKRIGEEELKIQTDTVAQKKTIREIMEENEKASK